MVHTFLLDCKVSVFFGQVYSSKCSPNLFFRVADAYARRFDQKSTTVAATSALKDLPRTQFNAKTSLHIHFKAFNINTPN
jgi:hypothetical protein